ncbi:MAG: hypothetical protein JNK82_13270 [Myxococcaceae bacterium]|nr:hypothetical protein [Myxococcaceae bacterium]
MKTKLLWWCLWLSLLLGCGGVEHRRRTFPVEAGSQPITGTNDFGWSVNVATAKVRVEAVRFYTGKVLITREWRFDPYVLIGGSAWAHPGHYVAGEALGELLTPVDVDLLAPAPVELGVAQAVTGDYGSLELTVTGAQVTGTATKGAQTVTFDSTAYSPEKALEGVKFEKVLRDEEGRVHLDVKLSTWLARIDFATPFTANGEAYNGFVRGIQDTSAYEVSWK